MPKWNRIDIWAGDMASPLASPRGFSFRRRVCTAAVLWAIVAWVSSAQAARPPMPELLPESTVLVVSIADARDLAQRFMNTSLGRMSRDPQLQPLINQLYGSLADAVAAARDRIGLSLPELLAIPQGEVTLALVAPEEGPPAYVVLVDAGKQLANARTLIETSAQTREKSGAITRSEENVSGTKLVIYTGTGPRKENAAYFEKEGTIVLGTNLDVLKHLLDAWNGRRQATLSANAEFTAVMQRCRDPQGPQPQLVCFFDPISLMKSIAQEQSGAQLTLALLPALGLDALQAVGGSLTLDAGQLDSIIHVHVLLDNPRGGLLEMIALGSGQTEPESWVPDDAASYMTLHVRFDAGLKSLVKVYDSFRGDGAFSNMLKQRVLDPTGADLEKDFLPAFEGRVSMVTRIQEPITSGSVTRLIGIRLKNASPVSKALEKVAEQNKSFLTTQSYAGKVFWQLTPPRLGEAPPDQSRPQVCFGLLGDYLLVADRSSIYQKALDAAANRAGSLDQALDFKLVASKIQREAGDTKPAMISFSRPEESLRMLYGMATDDQSRKRLRERAASNPFFRALDSALASNPLPPLAVLQGYFAPGGAMLSDDNSGLHYMWFSLRRKSE